MPVRHKPKVPVMLKQKQVQKKESHLANFEK